jgi:hypothetical protein
MYSSIDALLIFIPLNPIHIYIYVYTNPSPINMYIHRQELDRIQEQQIVFTNKLEKEKRRKEYLDENLEV